MSFQKRILSFAVVISVLLSQLTGCAQTTKSHAVLNGNIIEVEAFGHAVLDITPAAFYAAGFALGDIVSVTADKYQKDMPCYSGYYADAEDYMVRISPSDTNIALCINYGNFAEASDLGVGDSVTITLVEKGAALSKQELLSMEYSDDIADFDSDEVFSNFRPIEMGSIGDKKLYRSASPINDDRNRAAVTNALVRDVGINTIVNMADSNEEIAQYITREGFDSEFYRGLFEKGNVLSLNMSMDFRSDDFANKLIDGFTFIAQNEGPYLIHCNEGKDRTGFACMLIEMLMGADLNSIIEDYMLSYENYYGITFSTDGNKYQLILEQNLMEMLCFVTNVSETELLDSVDLSAAAEEWLLSKGMEGEAVKMLKRNLQ